MPANSIGVDVLFWKNALEPDNVKGARKFVSYQDHRRGCGKHEAQHRYRHGLISTIVLPRGHGTSCFGTKPSIQAELAAK